MTQALVRVQRAFDRLMQRVGGDYEFHHRHAEINQTYDADTGNVTTTVPETVGTIRMILTRSNAVTPDGIAIARTRVGILPKIDPYPVEGDEIVADGIPYVVRGTPAFHYISGVLVGLRITLEAGRGV